MKLYPLIAAVKTQEAFECALKSKVKSIALLKADINSLAQKVEAAKLAGKRIFLHIELIDGLSKDENAVKYIKQTFNPTGIITTKPSIVKICQQLNLTSVLRVFIFDNLSLQNAINSINSVLPERVEILPGIVPEIISTVKREAQCKLLVAGGLIETVEHVEDALREGVNAVSTSRMDLWNLSR